MTDLLHLAAPSVAVERLEPVRFGVLRLRRPRSDTLDRLASALGAALPGVGRIVPANDGLIAGLAPDEWALVGGNWELEAARAAAAKTCLASLVDLTDGHACWRISGSDAGALLSKGCTLDFHPRGFPAGTVAQSALAQTFVTILRPVETAAFLLIAERSYAHHLDLWWRDAIVEFLQPAGA